VNLTEQQDPWADWNRWCASKIEHALREFGPQIDKAFDNLAGQTSKALDDLTDEINEALRDLREALARERERSAKLRSDIEVLRVMVRSQNLGVTRSKRDVA
jgi:ABC-type transporter Mla subunit MlaD